MIGAARTREAVAQAPCKGHPGAGGVPALARAQVLRSFAGLRPFVPDKKPIIGRSGRLANVIVATGHEGDGITLAPITGALVADLARARAPALDIAALTPDRFAEAA